MSLYVTFIAFSFILRHTIQCWGTNRQSPTADLIWVYICPHFKKQGTTVRSDYFGAYYSIVCQEEHSWLKMTEFFKLYFNSVFYHYIRSVIPTTCPFPLTVNSTNECSIISPSIRKISEMQTWSWWFTQQRKGNRAALIVFYKTSIVCKTQKPSSWLTTNNK